MNTMREILEIGGAGFLIPVVLFVLVVYAIKGLYGLIGHRSRHRKEFLDLWDPARAQDDLWLEVIVRHHFGTTMPAGIIRLALAQPDKSQALLELCELWPLFRYDRDTQTVTWLHRWHVKPKTRRLDRRLMLGGYLVMAAYAVWIFTQVPAHGPSTVTGWTYAIGSVVIAGWALVALARHDTMVSATDNGDEWIRRINHRPQPPPPSAPTTE